MMNRVDIEPTMLRWACERAGYPPSHLAERIPQLPAWLRGEARPTLKQLEKLANATHTPLGYLFLPAPPEEPLPITDFRTVGDEVRGTPSPDLLDTIYLMQRRQAWLRESLIESGAEPLSFTGSATLDDDPESIGREMRRALGLTDGWGAGVRSWQEAVSELRRAIEQLGVMAVINGIVENNTHRKLDVQEFRGFTLTDPYAPLVFVNGADAKSAQMFSLAHELAHVWLGSQGLSGFVGLFPGGTPVEEWCNRAAAEMLVPGRELRERWREMRREERPFERLARAFKVSPVVAARRVLDLGLIDRDAFFDFYDEYVGRERHREEKGSGGGDFYNKQNTRVGELFATQVARAALEGRIGFKEAYELTGLNGATFEKYASRLGVELP
jgi:Zn-dependent peptidase ImmA (M78 family)